MQRDETLKEEEEKKMEKILKKDDKKNKLYPGKTKNKTIEDDDELNENRYTNCFKKYIVDLHQK